MSDINTIDMDRTFFPYPEVDLEDPDYAPVISEGSRWRLSDAEICKNGRYDGVCRAFLRTKEDGNWFADIYFNVYYNKSMIVGYRFIIEPDKIMSVNDEKQFRRCCEHRVFKYINVECFFEKVLEKYSVYPLSLDRSNYGNALLELYYTSRRGGLRELAFKSGLVALACNLHRIDDLDILETNLEKALDIPIKMLKKMDCSDVIEKYLITKESRERIAAIYNRYHSILNDVENLGIFQIKYLDDCINRGRAFDKKVLIIFNDLIDVIYDWKMEEYISGEEIYEQYLEYRSWISLLDKENDFFPHYPKLGEFDICEFLENYYGLRSFIMNGEDIDEELMLASKDNVSKYEYADEEYVVVIPKTYRDFVLEANMQRNCVIDYVEEVSSGETVIAFIRKAKQPHISYITMEISEDTIIQAKMMMNEDIILTEDKEFLKKYARLKGLYIDIDGLEGDDCYEILDNNIDLTEEAMKYFLEQYYDCDITRE